ncbi:MAG: hypothetical protein ACUVQ0_07025 [Thermoproteota archaeon]
MLLRSKNKSLPASEGLAPVIILTASETSMLANRETIEGCTPKFTQVAEDLLRNKTFEIEGFPRDYC